MINSSRRPEALEKRRDTRSGGGCGMVEHGRMGNRSLRSNKGVWKCSGGWWERLWGGGEETVGRGGGSQWEFQIKHTV